MEKFKNIFLVHYKNLSEHEILMPLDELAAGFMLEQEIHRRKNYPYIYFCPNCTRSFLSREKQDACKFCSGPVRLMTGGKKYVYFCPSCDARTESNDPKNACSTCGKRILTLYRWDMLQKGERRGIKAARLKKVLNELRPKIYIQPRRKKAEPSNI